MARRHFHPLLALAFLLCAAHAALAQRNQIWVNPGLTERGLQVGEQQILLRQDMSACHGSAFEQTRKVEDEHKRKTLGVAVFDRCMADKGWLAREPAPRNAPPKARESAT